MQRVLVRRHSILSLSGLLVVAFAGLLAGCSMVPMRSMLKLSTMGQDLLQYDPQFFRVAVQHDGSQKVKPEETRIVYVVTEKSGDVTEREFGLDLLATGQRPDRTLPVADAGQSWSLLSVAPSGVEAMRELQARLGARRDELSELAVTVQTKFDSTSDVQIREFPFEVWMLFEPEGKFIQILRGAFEMDPDDSKAG